MPSAPNHQQGRECDGGDDFSGQAPKGGTTRTTQDRRRTADKNEDCDARQKLTKGDDD